VVPEHPARGRRRAEIYRERLSVDDALGRIEALYKPYHRALRRLINKAHQAFGTVVVVDCHSMPSIGVSRDEPRRPDMVIGDRYGTSCAALLPDMVEETMRQLVNSVGRNKPYAGGFITEHYGTRRADCTPFSSNLTGRSTWTSGGANAARGSPKWLRDSQAWPTRWPPFRLATRNRSRPPRIKSRSRLEAQDSPRCAIARRWSTRKRVSGIAVHK